MTRAPDPTLNPLMIVNNETCFLLRIFLGSNLLRYILEQRKRAFGMIFHIRCESHSIIYVTIVVLKIFAIIYFKIKG